MGRMRKYTEKYGLVNCIIVLLCSIAFVVNLMFVDKASLLEISDNIPIAYLVNFLAGSLGVLIKWGSMSWAKGIAGGQIWRCVTHIYLHAGIVHLVMNMVALIIAGKYVEKKYGGIWYVAFFHIVAIVDSIITAYVFSGESVGASEGIFAVLGVLIILRYSKQIAIKKSETIFLVTFFIISLALGVGNLATQVAHLVALVMGLIVGVLMNKKGQIRDC